MTIENVTSGIAKRRLTNTHMALVRGWIQGVELPSLADRYLPDVGEEGDGVDLRVAKTVLTWVLDDLSSLAKRAGIAGGVTLRRQASRIRLEPNSPKLEDFANSLEDPDFYSETELVALYQDTFAGSANSAGRAEARRSRLIARQLNLITDLTHHLTAPMALADKIGGWFEDGIAEKLRAAELDTIEDLAVAIVRKPDEWYAEVQGIGAGKAGRIVRFLVAQLGPLDDALARSGIHVPFEQPRLDRDAAFNAILNSLPALPSPPPDVIGPNDQLSTAPSPPPLSAADLDGSQGRLRSRSGASSTNAKNDYEALQTWLDLKKSQKTRALYRREVQRVMAWAITQKGLPLSSLCIEDAKEFREFLQNVPDDWVGKKGPRAGLSGGSFKAFAGSLAESSARKSIVIIHGFFSWMVAQNYCVANPFAGVKVIGKTGGDETRTTSAEDLQSLEHVESKVSSFVTRTLPHAAIRAVERELAEAPQDEFIARARFVFRLAIKTGLRISEMAATRRGAMVRHEATATEEGFWELRVVGKRDKLREVPLPDSLICDLIEYLEHRNLPSSLALVEAGTYLIGRYPSDVPDPKKIVRKPVSASDGVREQTIHRTLVALFKRAVDRLGSDDFESAKRLKKSTTHWLRHTCATDAVAAGVPLEVVQETFGHSDIQTTGIYVHTENRRRAEQMKAYWTKADQKTGAG